MKPRFPNFPYAWIAAALALLVGGCAREVGQAELARATEGYVADTDKLFVVDCLLPGQVRQLGAQMTYLSQRRPIRATAADCEVRGGEYVAYDRANSASALNVWLPRAREGDAAAQVYVGEIFEKGLGQAVDYGSALQWYRKAADQGNSQAQLNLGHLYEKGLGVTADPAAAMNWYRKAAGLDSAGLQFTPAVTTTVPEAAAQAQELQSLRREAEQLRGQLQALREQVLDQQEALRNSQDELVQAQERYRRLQASSAQGGPEVQTLAAELKRKEAALQAQQAKVAALADALGKERAAARQELEAVRQHTGGNKAGADAEDELAAKMAAYQQKSAELTAWLTGGDGAARDRIDRRKRELQADARDIAALKDKLERQAAKAGGGATLASRPVIEILDPPVTLTRGLSSIQVSGGDKLKQITGKVAARAGLASVAVNDRPLTVGPDGVFRFPAELTESTSPFRIVATDRNRQKSELVVTLVAATAAAEADATGPAVAMPAATPILAGFTH